MDETFYWSRSGKRATAIEVECELAQSVNHDELRAAVLSALRVHRNFRARPVIVGRRFLVDTSEVEQVTVVKRVWPTAIHQELAALFPGTNYTDRGLHDFDSFPLGSVPCKQNNTIL